MDGSGENLAGEGALYSFLVEDNVEKIAEQVDKGLDVNQQFFWYLGELPDLLTNSPPLISVAAFHRAIKCFKFLLDHGADIKKLDELEIPVTNFAIAGGNMEIIKILDSQQVDFAKTLQIAAEYGHLEVFMWLLQNKSFDLHDRDQYNRTFLHIAAAGGNTMLVQFLIEKGLDVNEIDGVNFFVRQLSLY